MHLRQIKKSLWKKKENGSKFIKLIVKKIIGGLSLKFKEYPYERPDIDQLKLQISQYIQQFKKAEDVETQNHIIKKINDLRNNFETMSQLVQIRHTINTKDSFYDKENEYFDEINPIYERNHF